MYSLVVENIKCIIAAGGLGTRLQEFRGNKSTKILLDVNGTPMICLLYTSDAADE